MLSAPCSEFENRSTMLGISRFFVSNGQVADRGVDTDSVSAMILRAHAEYGTSLGPHPLPAIDKADE